MDQLGMPIEITEKDVARKRTFGGSLELCAEAGGFDLDKQLQQTLEVDKAQFSRWKNDQDGIHWKKLRRVMDVCGNHAPILWMLHELGYDIASLRKRETETEKLLRESEERVEKLQAEKEIMLETLRSIKAVG